MYPKRDEGEQGKGLFGGNSINRIGCMANIHYLSISFLLNQRPFHGENTIKQTDQKTQIYGWHKTQYNYFHFSLTHALCSKRPSWGQSDKCWSSSAGRQVNVKGNGCSFGEGGVTNDAFKTPTEETQAYQNIDFTFQDLDVNAEGEAQSFW